MRYQVFCFIFVLSLWAKVTLGFRAACYNGVSSKISKASLASHKRSTSSISSSPSSLSAAINIPHVMEHLSGVEQVHHAHHSLHNNAAKKTVSTTFAGKIWPVVRKFQLNPAKISAIIRNVATMTHWQDLVVLVIFAFGIMPGVRLSYNQIPVEKRRAEKFELSRRYQITQCISEISKVALSSYAVDVLCVALTTMGFHFPVEWDIPSIFTKSAYTIWALRRFLIIKRIALCRFWRIQNGNMGRLEIIDRILNGVSVTLVALLLFDWLSLQLGMAVKGIFAFGSVGTLAFTLASQGLVSQLLSGFFLTASNKANPGDAVKFGDGTSGQIIKLGWMDTVVQGGDNTMTSIPNSMLANQKVSNLSRVKLSQIKQTLRFHYDDADEIPALMQSIKKEIEDSCEKLVRDGSRPVQVFWTDYKEDYLEVMVNTHHLVSPLSGDYWPTRQKLLEAINRAVKKHGIQFAQLYSVVLPGQQPTWRAIPRPRKENE